MLTEASEAAGSRGYAAIERRALAELSDVG